MNTIKAAIRYCITLICGARLLYYAQYNINIDFLLGIVLIYISLFGMNSPITIYKEFNKQIQ